MFVPEYGFHLTEHDADRPWIVLNMEHRTATLEDGVDFHSWAREQWPADRWTIELDPFTNAPQWR